MAVRVINITVQQGEIQKRSGEAIVVNLFEGMRPGGATAAVDGAAGGLISAAVDSGDFTGKRNQTLLLYPGKEMEASRILVVGLGRKEEFSLEVTRQAAGTAANAPARPVKARQSTTSWECQRSTNLSNATTSKGRRHDDPFRRKTSGSYGGWHGSGALRL